jgi:protein-disulfide isomerase
MLKTHKAVIPLVLILFLFLGQAHAAPKGKQKYVSSEETLKILKTMGLAQGNGISYVKSSATSDKEWMTHLFMVQQEGSSLPLITYVNNHDVVVGILIRDGKLVTPKMPIDDIQRRIDMSKAKLSQGNRMAFNVKGKELVYMFTDPDCPYSQPIEKSLTDYSGKYKVVIKHFTLEQIHPGAKEKAIEKQCRWMATTCDSQTRQVAAQIVEEDIQEATALGVEGTPFFITAKGSVMYQIPDLKQQNQKK